MRRYQTIIAAGGLTLAIATLTACGPTVGPRACTEIGCSDQLTIQIMPAGDDFAVGTYQITTAKDGGTPTTCELVITDECAGADVCVSGESTCNGLVPGAPGAPYTIVSEVVQSIDVTVEKDSVVLADESFSPQYEEVQPNGDGCPPICSQASVVVQL